MQSNSLLCPTALARDWLIVWGLMLKCFVQFNSWWSTRTCFHFFVSSPRLCKSLRQDVWNIKLLEAPIYQALKSGWVYYVSEKTTRGYYYGATGDITLILISGKVMMELKYHCSIGQKRKTSGGNWRPWQNAVDNKPLTNLPSKLTSLLWAYNEVTLRRCYHLLGFCSQKR